MPSLGMFSLREDGYQRALEFYELSGNPDLKTTEGRRQFISFCAKKEIEVLKTRTKLRRRPEERTVLGKDERLISKKYGLHVLDGVRDMRPVVDAYWKTFHWTVYYFEMSLPINWSWVYPYADAPLLMDIAKYPETEDIPMNDLNFTVTHQLQFIMPQSSLRKAKRRVLFQDELHSETRNPWMKRHDWEMKPRISLPWNPSAALTTVSPLVDESHPKPQLD
jgi:hypothetical protein